MSLDKFGIGKSVKKTNKKTSQKNSVIEEIIPDNFEENEKNFSEISPSNEKKKNLKCTNAKCGYRRTLFKKCLSEEDYICRKCGITMKLVKN